MTFDPCSFLYEVAQTDNARTVIREVEGRRVVVVQSVEGANHVLRSNPGNYRKELWPFRQVMGASRLTEDGDNWAQREAVTQPYLAKFDPARLAIKSKEHADLLAARLLEPETAGRLEQFAIDVTTIRVLSDTLLDGRLADEAEDFASDLHVMLDYAASYAFSGRDSNTHIDRQTTRNLARIRQRMLHRLTQVRQDLPAGDIVLHALDAADRDGPDGFVFEHELMQLFSAGADTSAAALGWCCQALAENQSTQDNVRAEVSALQATQLSDPAVISRLPWLNGLVDETLRLYPPIPMLGRLAKAPDVVDQFNIEPETLVFVSLIGVHRNHLLWPDPDAFCARRHGLDGARTARAMPFSTGPRICGGSRFAIIELKVILASLVRQLHFVPSELDPGEFQWRISMRRKLGHPVNVLPLD